MVQRVLDRPATERHVEVEPILLRVPEVAAYLSLGRTTVLGLISTGELPVQRFGRAVRVSRSALDEFVARRDQAARKSA